MARTKKVTTDNNILQPEVSISELWDVLKFSKNLIGGMYPGIMTPDLLNSRMKDTSYSPMGMTEEQLMKALNDPKNSEESLRSVVEYMELVSSPFRRVINYMASQLGMDYTYTVTNVTEMGEYKKPAFKKDQKVVFDWLDRFDHKYHFRNITKQLLRNEVFVGCIRDEGKQIVIQELPLQYVKLTAKWDYGYLASFNFVYFLQPGTNLDMFPRFFKEKFLELFGGKTNLQQYNPALSPELRGDSQYVYWVDLPPQVAFVFKLDPSITTAVPMYASLVPDLINQPMIRSLQKNMNMSAASKMLVGQVPMLKDTKAKVSDMIAIDPATLGKFLALVKSSLAESVKVASAPLENLQAISFDTDNKLYDDFLRTAVSASGVNSALIYSGTLKANAIESQLSFQSDSLIMEQSLYPQFSSFINYNLSLNKDIKKYKYLLEFEGNDYYLDREQRFDYAMSLSDHGIFLPQKIAAARGIKPQTLFRMMEESKGMGFTDLLTPIALASQMSGKPNAEGGRPSKSDSEISDSGEQTRTDGGNLTKGGTQ